MATTILLIRHGITQSNINHVYMGFSDEESNEEGQEQIHKLALNLKAIPIDAIYSSPLRRTRTAAKRIADEHSLDYETIDGLNEIDLGEWEGLSKEKIQSNWPKLWEQVLHDPGEITLPAGESFRVAMGRAVLAFEEIAKNNLNKCIAIVTHDVIIKMIVMHVLNAPTSIYHNFQIDCASVSKIAIKNGVARVIFLNLKQGFYE